MLKAVEVIRFLSVILFLVILSWIYAYLPIQVDLTPTKGDLQIHKASVFYWSVGFFIVINLLATILFRILKNKVGVGDFFAWMKGLVPAINIYLTLMVGFIGVINNPTHISASSYQYLNYLAPFMLVVWLLGLIFFYIGQRKSA